MASIIKANQLQDFGGNSIIGSDGAGNLTTQKTNYPAFFAYLSANQDLPNNVATKINVNTETFDTNNCYDNSTNYRFTPTVAGKYYLFGSTIISALTDDTAIIYIYKNGSNLAYRQVGASNTSGGEGVDISFIDEANGTTDYYELFAYQNSGSTKNNSGDSTQRRTFFGAYRIGS